MALFGAGTAGAGRAWLWRGTLPGGGLRRQTRCHGHTMHGCGCRAPVGQSLGARGCFRVPVSLGLRGATGRASLVTGGATLLHPEVGEALPAGPLHDSLWPWEPGEQVRLPAAAPSAHCPSSGRGGHGSSSYSLKRKHSGFEEF